MVKTPLFLFSRVKQLVRRSQRVRCCSAWICFVGMAVMNWTCRCSPGCRTSLQVPSPAPSSKRPSISTWTVWWSPARPATPTCWPRWSTACPPALPHPSARGLIQQTPTCPDPSTRLWTACPTVWQTRIREAWRQTWRLPSVGAWWRTMCISKMTHLKGKLLILSDNNLSKCYHCFK